MRVNEFIILQLIFLSVFLKPVALSAQDTSLIYFDFSPVKAIEATPVKNQFNSNTCWSFAVISLLESELLRQGKGPCDLSELYVVRHTYTEKALKYVRMHGHINFTDGGEANDVIDVIKNHGIVPEEVYPFSIANEKNYNREMDIRLKAYINNVIENDILPLPSWYDGFEDILNSYLGEAPDTFVINEKVYTPESYADELDLVPDDYILVTSFTHHPFYSQFVIELPDNWSWGKAYNVPLDELIEIIDSAVNKGYTVLWAADVSEKGFDFKKGLAIIPEKIHGNIADTVQATTTDYIREIKENETDSINHGCEEKTITQEIRQEGFDNYTTTDDHSMHIIGISKGPDDSKYYYVKNSWGTNSFYRGYLHVSEDYIRYKTILLMLNRKALPEKTARKLNAK